MTNPCDAAPPSVSVVASQIDVFQGFIAVVVLHRTHKHLSLSPAADAINNAAGFGFNGYNKDGSPRWDLISNLRILDIEVRLLFFRLIMST